MHLWETCRPSWWMIFLPLLGFYGTVSWRPTLWSVKLVQSTSSAIIQSVSRKYWDTACLHRQTNTSISLSEIIVILISMLVQVLFLCLHSNTSVESLPSDYWLKLIQHSPYIVFYCRYIFVRASVNKLNYLLCCELLNSPSFVRCEGQICVSLSAFACHYFVLTCIINSSLAWQMFKASSFYPPHQKRSGVPDHGVFQCRKVAWQCFYLQVSQKVVQRLLCTMSSSSLFSSVSSDSVCLALFPAPWPWRTVETETWRFLQVSVHLPYNPAQLLQVKSYSFESINKPTLTPCGRKYHLIVTLMIILR